MSIASEITDLNTNLEAAKDAVTDKGGTVGDTGLAGLAAEIESIPSGGGPITSYGSIKYLDSNDVAHTVELATLDDYLSLSHSNTTEVNLVINGVTVNSHKITEVEVVDGVTFVPDRFLYYDYGLTKLTLPSSIQTIGTTFLGYCTHFNSQLNLEGVTTIGSYFMQGCTAFNQPLSLPQVRTINGNFLDSCTAFNSSLSLGNNVLTLSTYFMYGCTSFAQPLTIPASIAKYYSSHFAIGNYFMQNCNNFTGPLTWNCPADRITANKYNLATSSSSAAMYTTGVTITGTYAQDLKNLLADSDSSPYRKLIVGS